MAHQQLATPIDPLPRYGRRITLRRLHLDDLTAFQAYRHDPEVGRYQGWTPQSNDDATRFIEEMVTHDLFVPDQWCQIGISDKDTDTLIGDLGIIVKEDGEVGEIGFSLRAESQGDGLAFEAVSLCLQLLFEQTALDRIQGITDSRNEPSIRLMERLGMRRLESIETEFRGLPCIEFLYLISRTTFNKIETVRSLD